MSARNANNLMVSSFVYMDSKECTTNEESDNKNIHKINPFGFWYFDLMQ